MLKHSFQNVSNVIKSKLFELCSQSTDLSSDEDPSVTLSVVNAT